MPSKIAFLFPGQGAQYVGMGKDLYEHFRGARHIYDQADAELGFALSRLCFEGPEEKLTRTCFAQPAIFVTSLAALAILEERYPELNPSLAAGLSLGEFTALVAARSLSFEEGLKLVEHRAKAMERAAEKYSGTMASILGLSREDCEALAREAGCEVANLNAPDQMVISGRVDAVERGCVLAEGMGAKRAVRLKVGGAFHSSLMKEAQSDLETALSKAKIQTPACLFVANATGQRVSNPDQIRRLLARQLTSPVHWSHTLKLAFEAGMDCFLEVGPGKVLKGLARSNGLEVPVYACGKRDEVEKLEEIFAAS